MAGDRHLGASVPDQAGRASHGTSLPPFGDHPSRWQPIETAPRDEEVYILAIREGAKVPFVASYDADFDNWFTFNGALEACGQKFEPTHWMPLPAPPVSK